MFELVELLSQVNTQIFRTLSPIAKENNISITELIILWKINKKGSYRITDLSKQVGLPASTLTGVFDRLESKEYLVRVHDNIDRRSVLIQGTPQLKKMIDSVVQNADKELINLLGTLPPGFIDRFMQDLTELKTHLLQKMTETQVERKL